MWFWLILAVILIWIFWPKGGKKTNKKRSRSLAGSGRSYTGQIATTNQEPSLEDLGLSISVSYGGGPSYRPGPTADPVWLGPGQSLTVGGVRIDDPLTYTAIVKHKGRSCADPSQIAPWLDVGRSRDSTIASVALLFSTVPSVRTRG